MSERYYASPPRSFWQWQDDGETIAWRDGSTIAFRAEVHAVLRSLAPNGLPQFETVVLLLASLRNNWQESSSGLGDASLDFLGGFTSKKNSAIFGEVVGQLNKLGGLNESSRNSILAKTTIAGLVFEGTRPYVSSGESDEIANIASQPMPEMLFGENAAMPWSANYDVALNATLHAMKHSLSKVTEQRIRNRMESGIDSDVIEAELVPPTPETIRSLLLDLQNDSEFSGLAKLAQQLLAAVSIPRKLSQPDERPEGGVSDISNRGPLDRLLVSELAHDDLTLAVRVANNEALYLRREAPPTSPPQHRAILVDVGIRTWGVPRLYATAVALAMLALKDNTVETDVFRGDGDKLESVDLSTRQGIAEHLGQLTVDLHPGPVLGAFKDRVLQIPGAAEPILILSADTMADADFVRHVQGLGMPLYVATVDIDGKLELTRRSREGIRPIRSAHMPLEKILDGGAKTAKVVLRSDSEKDLPAIFHAERFPLRVSSNLQLGCCRLPNGNALSVGQNRQLHYWDANNRDTIRRGPLLLHDHLPSVTDVWFAPTYGDLQRMIIGDKQKRECWFVEANLAEQNAFVQPLRITAYPWTISVQGEFVLAVNAKRVDVLEIETGNLRDQRELPKGSRAGWNRFVVSGDESDSSWIALDYDGLKLNFHSAIAAMTDLPTELPAESTSRIIAMIETQGVEGPIGITSAGDLFYTATQEFKTVNHLLTGKLNVAAVSSSGDTVVLSGTSQYTSYSAASLVEVDTKTGRSTSVGYGDPMQLAEKEPGNIICTKSIRNKFRSIGVNAKGELTLESRKHDFLSLSCIDRLEWAYSDSNIAKSQLFVPYERELQTGYQLFVAKWEDGSRAWLDTRGLLHLQSADTSIDEVSIVLSGSAETAGWTPCGGMWGTQYFTGLADRGPERELFVSCIDCFVARLP